MLPGREGTRRSIIDGRAAIVINPGSHPEPMHLARALARAGIEVHYFTSSSISRGSRLGRRIEGGAVRPQALRAQLARRLLPAWMDDVHVHRVAGVLDATYFVGGRTGAPALEALADLRNARVRRAALPTMARLGTRLGWVVAQQTAAFRSREEVPNRVAYLLNYPIAHHRWTDASLREERRRNPDWAPYLQGADLAERLLRSYDAEVRAADAILLNSTFCASTFLEQGIPGRSLHVVSLGADPPPEPPRRPATTRRGPDMPLRVVYAGQLTQRKGLSYLIDACERVEGVSLTLIGQPVRGIEERLAGHPTVRLHASVSRQRLAELYADFDVFAMPSLSEGFGLAALEAMAAGLPVILSERSFAHDVVDEGVNGFVVPAADADAIRERLLRFRQDPPLLRAMSAAAAATARRFTWDSYERHLLEVLLGQPG